MKRSTRFRLLVEAPEILLLPGVHDALTLRLAEQAGFEAVTCGGYAATASLLGVPDMAQLGMSEMAEMYARLCDQTELPVFADADTGYGGTANVARTVRAFERAGVAGLFIEDQLAPKRCGHTRGKQVVAREEALLRVRAAVDAREQGADVLILARTDARGPLGLDEALWRGRAFADLGADIVFVEAPRSEAEMQRICEAIRAPQLANLVEGGDTPMLPPARLAALGYRIAAYPLTLLSAAARAMQDALAALARGETPARLLEFAELRELVGFDAYDAALERYGKDG